jgi:hypothetical protein
MLSVFDCLYKSIATGDLKNTIVDKDIDWQAKILSLLISSILIYMYSNGSSFLSNWVRILGLPMDKIHENLAYSYSYP